MNEFEVRGILRTPNLVNGIKGNAVRNNRDRRAVDRPLSAGSG